MSKSFAAVALVMCAFPLAIHAQRGRGAAPLPPRSSAGHGIDVPGWWARVDKPGASFAGLSLRPDGSAIHATTGPSAIFWDPQQSASGHYTVKARFTLNRMPKFEEGYGLFIGGANLDKDNERLTAFLLHEDGSYAVLERRGVPKTAAEVAWIPDPALARPDASDRETNDVSIEVGPVDVVFMANGKEVTRRPTLAIDTDGIVGLRVADHMDVRVDGFAVIKK